MIVTYYNLLVLSLIATLSVMPSISYPLTLKQTEIVSQSIPIRDLKVGDTAYIASIVENSLSEQQNLEYITEVTDANDVAVAIEWFDGKIEGDQTIQLSNEWVPEEQGKYTVRVFLWSDDNEFVNALAAPNDTTLQIT